MAKHDFFIFLHKAFDEFGGHDPELGGYSNLDFYVLFSQGEEHPDKGVTYGPFRGLKQVERYITESGWYRDVQKVTDDSWNATHTGWSMFGLIVTPPRKVRLHASRLTVVSPPS